MTLPATTKKKLSALTSLLESTPVGELDARQIGDRIDAVLALLAEQEPQWIDLEAARKLLGNLPEAVMLNWLRLGLLMSRTQPDGSQQVRLDDVLRNRRDDEVLASIGEPLSEAELRSLKGSVLSSNRWDVRLDPRAS